MNIANSDFSGNALANVRVQVNAPGTYRYTFQGSTFTSATSDNLVVNLLPGGEGSTMNFLETGDSFVNTLAGTAGVRLGWNGIISAPIYPANFFSCWWRTPRL